MPYSFYSFGRELDLFGSLFQIFSLFFLVILGAFLCHILCKFFQVSNKIGFMLYAYHLFFGLVYLVFVSNFGGDAIGYFIQSLETTLRDFQPGTIAVEYLTAFFSRAGFSVVGVFTVFNIFGFIGLLAFYACLDEVTIHSSRRLKQLVLLIVFLPSISFWSAGLGKDAISFMAMGLALYAALDFYKRVPLLILAIAFMLFVRPHIAGMMLIAVVFSAALSREIPFTARVIIGFLGFGLATVMIPFALNYAGVNEDASNLGQYIDARASSNQGGGSSLDIASLPLPLKMFTYLFRPLPFEARSITTLLAAIDNMVILYLSYVAFKVRATIRGIALLGNRVFMWSYVLIAWVLLSMTTANLGIAMRQKWMFAPILIFLLISIIAASDGKCRK
ncbi:hypothetical protein LTQ03_05875 [Vibrio splendidus]|uniref:hypothetical protein n=1 Tax=Vibrio splendidus TaxID=29497 RepID=UPI001FB21D52|nr:hypothetical protein [Vibrio splendidus]UOE80912.1 hypothetical protein LTQ03_05875 [Vibrio splendidus]